MPWRDISSAISIKQVSGSNKVEAARPVRSGRGVSFCLLFLAQLHKDNSAYNKNDQHDTNDDLGFHKRTSFNKKHRLPQA